MIIAWAVTSVRCRMKMIEVRVMEVRVAGAPAVLAPAVMLSHFRVSSHDKRSLSSIRLKVPHSLFDVKVYV